MYETIVDGITELARECGLLIKNVDREHAGIESKGGHGNLVTYYDKMVQDKLQEGLKRLLPEAVFYGEEEVAHQDISKGYAFIVDPIDGTTNFVMQNRQSAISIGLVKDMERVAGVVYNPFQEEMYTAIKGQGAYLNGHSIHVSPYELKDNVAIFGTSPYYDDISHSSFEKALKYFDNCLDIRRFGAASLDLCAVAAGRAAIYFEERLSPWDYAAGSLILEEAGGLCRTYEGEELTVGKKCSVIGANMESSILWNVFRI